MGILEHVKILETKIDKEIDLAKRLMEENEQLTEERDQLREKAGLYERQIEDLEALIDAYREEQHAIESGILSALNRLNQFEDAVEKKLIPLSASSEAAEPAGSEESEKGEAAAEPNSQIDGETPVADSESEANLDQPKTA